MLIVALLAIAIILNDFSQTLNMQKTAQRKRPNTRTRTAPTPNTINALRDALQDQIDAECEFAIATNQILDARDKQAEARAKQQLQRAKLARQAASAYAKAARLQAQIDKLSPE